MKSHYIPKLILRNFNLHVNYYNLKENKLQKEKNINKIFVEKDLYPDDLEMNLCKKVESCFGDLLNNKILKYNKKLILNKKEVLIMKKYILCSIMRHVYLLKEESIFQQKFINLQYKQLQNIFGNMSDRLDNCEIKNETDYERFLRNLQVIVDCDNLENIQEHPLATRELKHWSIAIYVSYFSFWDSSISQEEFILVDEPLVTNAGFGNQLKKTKILMSILQQSYFKNISIDNNFLYILNGHIEFSDNYWIFPVSKERAMICINPFYKYFLNTTLKSYVSFASLCPNIRMKLIEEPINTYKENEKQYIYYIKFLNQDELRLNNSLLLNECQETLIFNDFNKIKNSLIYYQNRLENGFSNVKNNYVELIKYEKEK